MLCASVVNVKITNNTVITANAILTVFPKKRVFNITISPKLITTKLSRNREQKGLIQTKK